jgi:serine/threonine-protein kinase
VRGPGGGGDFGIARFADESAIGLTATGQVMGTSSYLAPERALGRAAGPPADIYALGCVLYQLLTGGPPFQADTATAVVYQHVDAAPASLRHYRPDLPEPFDTYVLAMLAKDPEQRPTAQQAADTFTEPLTAWNPPVPPPAPTLPLPTAGNTTRRLDAAAVAAPARQQASGRLNTRRSRAIVGSVVAGTIAAVTVATIAATSGNDDYKPPSAGSSTTPAAHSPATTSATSTGPAPVMTTATKATPSATHSTHTKRPAGKATPSAKKKNPPHAKKTPPPPHH